jgi:NAD(P)-dependent dehydrogenase (short-subunit alcohol dehydrogenase family)
MAGRLQDKTALITGGAQGIGRAIAERYVADGAKVAFADFNAQKGNAAAGAIGAHFIHADLSKPEDARRAVDEAIAHFGHLDILVNNAGIAVGGDFLDLKLEDFDRVLAVNLRGAFVASQEAARHMVARVQAGHKPGCIVNMSSVNAVFALPAQLPYSVSKGGMSSLTKAVALSLAPHGIRVNAIGPGSIMTDMLASVNADPAARDRLLSRTPMGRIGEASEIASVAAFLASDDASYMTGQTVYVDGGRLPLNYTVPVKPS